MHNLCALDANAKKRDDLGPTPPWGLLEITLDEDLAKCCFGAGRKEKERTFQMVGRWENVAV